LGKNPTISGSSFPSISINFRGNGFEWPFPVKVCGEGCLEVGVLALDDAGLLVEERVTSGDARGVLVGAVAGDELLLMTLFKRARSVVEEEFRVMTGPDAVRRLEVL